MSRHTDRSYRWRRASKATLLKGMQLCLANAASLLKAARTLHHASCYNAAFVLGALALEEAGKVVYLTILSHSDRDHLSDKTYKELHQRFFDHSTKTQLALHGAWKSVLYVRRRKNVSDARAKVAYRKLVRAYGSVDDYVERTPGADDIADLKLLALYVGSRQDVLAKPARVPSAVAAGLIVIVQSIIEDARRLRDTFRRSKTDRLAESIIVVMFKREMLQQMLKTLQSEQPPPVP